jgi:hypothetical protein
MLGRIPSTSTATPDGDERLPPRRRHPGNYQFLIATIVCEFADVIQLARGE